MDVSETATAAIKACAFKFPGNQLKNYHKTEFIMHSRVATVVGDQLGRIFYDDENDTWLLNPSQLREIVMANVLQNGGGDYSGTLYSSYPIYGAAIAFEPGIWTSTTGLEKGVTYPATSKACLEDMSYCSPNAAEQKNNLQLTGLNQNNGGMELYCPYAFRGPTQMEIYNNCSRERPEFCPSMDLAFA